MKMSRRKFLAGAAAVGAMGPVASAPGILGLGSPDPGARGGAGPATASGAEESAVTGNGGALATDPTRRFDPWVEVTPEALVFNVEVVSRLVGGRPILAVVKNNAYGLDLVTAGRILEGLPQVWGLAVVKTEAALALRAAGVKKPVVLMALFADEDGPDLVARGVDLCLTTDDAGERVERAARAAGVWPRVHAYLDTGMSRMGVPYHRAVSWLTELAERGLQPHSTFMGFTEDPEYDREQLRRFMEVARRLRRRGVDPGVLHAASSAAVFNFPEGHLDMVRPGISLFGAYPSNEGHEREIAELRPAFRLRARVVRVERLRPGDSVSYGREYVADRAIWVATLPVGHSDGYPREAVEGARILVNGRLHPAIGAVSASHTVVELGSVEERGEDPGVRIGDVATFLGPDDPEVHPNTVATRTGRSVYDVLMHLNAGLPRAIEGEPRRGG